MNGARIQVNVPIAASEFDYQFPAGTNVKYEGRGRRAIALADGTLRPVTAGELATGIPLEELMNTAPPPEALPVPDRPF